MRLISARFENFRILRDVEIKFSTNEKKSLTIIRAENETGKTTMLRGLQWAIFGDDALPGKPSEFRIHPLDWDLKKSKEVPIKVTIKFEYLMKHFDKIANHKSEELYKYKLVRTARESILDNDKFKRTKSDLTIFKITDEGHDPIPNPESRIKQILGSNLKDLFFTDGDRALTFISSEVPKGQQRKIVRSAIRDMLSFEVIENAQKHVKQTIKDIRDKTKDAINTEDLKNAVDRLDRIEKSLEENEINLIKMEKQITEGNSQLKKTETKLEDALKKGDREDLVIRKQEYEKVERSYIEEYNTIISEHAKLFSDELIANTLLNDHIKKTYEYLNVLREQGTIPKASLPYLQERLELELCICDTPLKQNTPPYDAIVNLIKDQEKHSDYDDRITSLRFDGKKIIDYFESDNPKWTNLLKERIKQRHKKSDELKGVQGKLKRIQNEIENIQETDIQQIRDKKTIIKESLDNLRDNKSRMEIEIRSLEDDKALVESEYNKLVTGQEAAKSLGFELQAANDIYVVLQDAYEEIEKSEIPKVSAQMNSYFLEMIRSSSDKNSLIVSTEVDDDYDIIVYGPQKKMLDPDNDLNGASRRALTLSFILALTNVSGIIAPNVIDTPLGMMDPLIKKSVLGTLVKKSHQPILFLTRSEIRDIEDILDKECGQITTVTNSSHYPKKIVNDLGLDYIAAVTCDCNHRHYCEVCETIDDYSDDRLSRN